MQSGAVWRFSGLGSVGEQSGKLGYIAVVLAFNSKVVERCETIDFSPLVELQQKESSKGNNAYCSWQHLFERTSCQHLQSGL